MRSCVLLKNQFTKLSSSFMYTVITAYQSERNISAPLLKGQSYVTLQACKLFLMDNPQVSRSCKFQRGSKLNYFWGIPIALGKQNPYRYKVKCILGSFTCWGSKQSAVITSLLAKLKSKSYLKKTSSGHLALGFSKTFFMLVSQKH